MQLFCHSMCSCCVEATVICSDDRPLPVDVPLDNKEGQYGASRAVFVAAGNRHSCVLVSHSGRMAVHACGSNVYGQLGLGHLQCTTRCAY